ncbi:DUF6531 domain-containing protein [Chitinimonas lacunae]|uniref:DUF6531 domain-containing protein n=1 Tax=Chitinimonas lacunae TaxID=1963018 RepID=A0ABV8MRA3_9NEIS
MKRLIRTLVRPALRLVLLAVTMVTAAVILCLPTEALAQRRLPGTTVIGYPLPLQPMSPGFSRIFSAVDSHTRPFIVAPIADNEDEWPADPCESTVPGISAAVGNPIVVQSGNKIQIDTDFGGTGEMPLELVRSYSAASDHERGLWGAGWSSNVEHTLAFYTGTLANPVFECEARLAKASECARVTAPTALVVRTESGREYRYDWHHAASAFRSNADPLGSIVKVPAWATCSSVMGVIWAV